MVGQGESPADQTEAKIAQVAEAEITRAARLAREADKAAGKKHHGQQDDSGASEDEAEDGAAPGGHHPKFNRQRPPSRDRLRDRSWTLQEELGRIKWQGEKVFRTPAHNALASRAILDQLMPLLPKDSEEVNLQVKRLHAMLDTATMTDPALNRGAGRRG
jgi:hypothetical protein